MDTLKNLRKEKKLLQKDIAKLLGISVSTYSNWEQGKFEPDNASLQKLADYFNVSVDYLLGRESDSGIINTNANLAPIENDVLTLFRKLNKQDQFKALGFLQALAS